MPLDWESRYQLNDTPWEKGAPSPGLVDWLANHSVDGRVLVPGCGSGHDVRALASSGAEVIGLDLAPSAIRQADSWPKVGNERYVQGDFFALPETERHSCDWIFEHTCFCAIDPGDRPAYVRSALAALKEDGCLLAVFYLDPRLDPGESGPPFGVTPAELDRLFAPHFFLLEQWTPARTYRGREGAELMQWYRKRAAG